MSNEYDEHLLYELHDMKHTSSDYEIISKCFKDTMNIGRPTKDKIYRFEKWRKVRGKNLLLLHSTSIVSAVETINGGFLQKT